MVSFLTRGCLVTLREKKLLLIPAAASLRTSGGVLPQQCAKNVWSLWWLHSSGPAWWSPGGPCNTDITCSTPPFSTDAPLSSAMHPSTRCCLAVWPVTVDPALAQKPVNVLPSSELQLHLLQWNPHAGLEKEAPFQVCISLGSLPSSRLPYKILSCLIIILLS